MSAAILVCPLSRLSGTLAASGARSLVSLSSGPAPPLPRTAGLRHLTLDVSDIVAPRDGHVLADAAHMADLLAFVRSWDRSSPLLVHCHAGVSRSPAAAYAALCALRPDTDEAALAAGLRAASPSATPNPRLVALADAALGRSGRMIAAVQAIGRGRDCFEGEVFRLEVPSADQMLASQL